MPWITPDAPTHDELSACVQCGLCLPHCPTFRLTGRETASPRGRLMAMAAVADGRQIDDAFVDMMGFCLQCRACEAVCPSFAPFGRAMEGARAEIAAQRPASGQTPRHFVVGRVLGRRGVMRLVTTVTALVQRFRVQAVVPKWLRSGLRGLRPLPVSASSRAGRRYPAVGERTGTAALLAGCVMDPWFGDVHEATIGVLQHAGFDVVVPESQTCCGALAAHDGAVSDARRLAARNVAAFRNADLVVVDAAGCGAHLKEYGHWAGDAGERLAARVRDVTEVLAEALADGRLPHLEIDRGPVAVQDPCHLRHAQRITAPPRQVVAAAGYRPVEIDPAGLCCGAAGIYSLLQPEASAELGQRKAEQVKASGSTIVASANPGCEMQLRSNLDSWYRVVHPVELYWEALQEDGTG
jgi:glycolate oxidase iron-sulfur subunit